MRLGLQALRVHVSALIHERAPSTWNILSHSIFVNVFSFFLWIRANHEYSATNANVYCRMSSRMLHGSKHCNVQQVLPLESFGTLTVLHLPNKNYRRVGRMHNRCVLLGRHSFLKK
jgi:hypothetical protein